METKDFEFKLKELYRLVHLLKMDPGVNFASSLFDELNTAEDSLLNAILHLNEFEYE